MLDFYVYILRCNDGSYYVGHTDNIEFRLNQHIETDPHSGSYVSKRLPAEVVYVECLGSRHDALEAERKLKGWSRKKKEALIYGGFVAVQEFIVKYKSHNYNSPVDPSTSSGRTGEEVVRRENALNLVFTAERVEASGRTGEEVVRRENAKANEVEKLI